MADSLPEGRLRDVAFSASSMALVEDADEEAALVNAQQIKDDALRIEAAKYALKELADYDREEAERIAKEHGYELEALLDSSDAKP